MMGLETASDEGGLLRGETAKVLVEGDSLRTLGELAPELIPREAPRKMLTGPPAPVCPVSLVALDTGLGIAGMLSFRGGKTPCIATAAGATPFGLALA
jgi:hypothetical protein